MPNPEKFGLRFLGAKMLAKEKMSCHPKSRKMASGLKEIGNLSG
jgi:hypothetical protein